MFLGRKGSLRGCAAGEGGDVHLAWHPASDDVLAVTVSGGVLLVEIMRLRAAGGNESVACEPGALPEGALFRRIGSARTACVAFSPDGALLATGGADGRVGLSHALSQRLHETQKQHRRPSVIL